MEIDWAPLWCYEIIPYILLCLEVIMLLILVIMNSHVNVRKSIAHLWLSGILSKTDMCSNFMFFQTFWCVYVILRIVFRLCHFVSILDVFLHQCMYLYILDVFLHRCTYVCPFWMCFYISVCVFILDVFLHQCLCVHFGCVFTSVYVSVHFGCVSTSVYVCVCDVFWCVFLLLYELIGSYSRNT
jgi:hypothetical protein